MSEEDRKGNINYLEYQINDGYLDIRDHSGDEVAFNIIQEAIQLYKEKYRME